MKKKVIALVLVCVLVFGVAVGGTLAWLADKTETVKNTFVVGDVEIELTESGLTDNATTQSFDLLPGVDIEKDPKVTVLANSEKCYLFVEVTEENKTVDGTEVYSYAMAEGWLNANVDDKIVYYRIVNEGSTDQDFKVLDGDKVSVNSNLTAADCEKLESDNVPTLSFTAYAVQFEGIVDSKDDDDTAVLEAWAAAQTAVETNA